MIKGTQWCKIYVEERRCGQNDVKEADSIERRSLITLLNN